MFDRARELCQAMEANERIAWEKLAREGISAEPDNSRFHRALGDLLALRGEHAAALAPLKASVLLEGNASPALESFTECLVRADLPKTEAIAAAREITVTGTGLREALAARERMFRETGEQMLAAAAGRLLAALPGPVTERKTASPPGISYVRPRSLKTFSSQRTEPEGFKWSIGGSGGFHAGSQPLATGRVSIAGLIFLKPKS